MAIIKHIAVKNRFYSDAVEYLTCKFDEYTNQPVLDEKGRIQERNSYLIEGINCDVDSFGVECIETNQRYGKNNSPKDVKAHHYIISFEPTDKITMEQAMDFGKKWLSTFAPGHQSVLAVHPDGHNGSQNMHVHVVFNSVRKYEAKREKWHEKACEWKLGCKHKSTGKMMYHAKKWVMRQCILLGYGQVNLLTKKHTDNYWVEKRLMDQNAKDGVGVSSNRELIRNTIDKMISAAESLEQLVELLKYAYGWKIRMTNKTISFATPDMKQSIRGNKLGEGYGKAELSERIAQMLAKRKELQEAHKIEMEKIKAMEEEAAEERRQLTRKFEMERKAFEMKSRKRSLSCKRNDILNKLYWQEMDRADWNKDYVQYLDSQRMDNFMERTEEELSSYILTREEFEEKQAVSLYKEKAERAGELWIKALSELSVSTHSLKWKYMDYLEAIKFKKPEQITLEEAKEEIVSYEAFVEMSSEGIEEIKQQSVETVIEPKVEKQQIEKPVSIEYSKLSLEERAALLPVPTGDVMAEYGQYQERMGYTPDRMKSIRYKMEVFDQFMKEYEYRKRKFGCREEHQATNRKKDRGER